MAPCLAACVGAAGKATEKLNGRLEGPLLKHCGPPPGVAAAFQQHVPLAGRFGLPCARQALWLMWRWPQSTRSAAGSAAEHVGAVTADAHTA